MNQTTLWVGHFKTISGHFSTNYTKNFHKIKVQAVILRCLVCLNLNWTKSYDIILVKNIFFSYLKMHHFRAISPKWVLAPPKEKSSHIFKMAIFSKFFGSFMRHIVRSNTGKKIELFLELLTNTVFSKNFCLIHFRSEFSLKIPFASYNSKLATLHSLDFFI
jgi:hypothetical protein